MTTPVVILGQTVNWPTTGDVNYGNATTQFVNLVSAALDPIAGLYNTTTGHVGELALNNSDQLTLNGIPIATGSVTSITVNGTSGRISSSGSPITTSGTIALDLISTAVTPGSYTNVSLTVDAYGRITAASSGTSGTVTSVAVTGNNGISISGSPITSSGTFTLGLGAITPTSVNASGTVTGSNLSGTNTGDQTITLTGDVTGSGTGSFATTLATVNSNVGQFAVHTVNAKGLTTAATNLTGDVTSSGATTTLANTAVTPGSYTSANITVDAKGRVTSASNGTAPVTSVTGTSGRISSTGGTTPVLDLVTTAVTPGSYTASNITVDAYGRITAAANGSGGGGVTSFETSLNGLTPNTTTSGAITLAGTLGVASGGTGLTSLTAGYIPYGNGTSALNNSNRLVFGTVGGASLTVGDPTGSNTATISRPNLLSGSLSITNSSGGTAANIRIVTSSSATIGNISLEPKATGGVVVIENATPIIQSSSSGTGATLTIGLVDNNTTNKVDVSGPSAANYATGLANTNLVNKYYVDNAISSLVTSVSGTTNRITSTGGATPVIDISASYVGQSSITTLGTVTTGVWNGTKVSEVYGGTNQSTYTTGDILYASASNTLSKLAVGSNTNVLTLAGGVPTWAAPATNGTVTSVAVSGGTTGLTTTGGPITTSGTITLSGTLDVDNGGTGQTSYTDGQLLIGNTTGNTLAKATLTAGTNIAITNGAGSITVGVTGTVATATTATNIAGGTANQIPYQTGAGATSFYSGANYGVQTYTSVGVPSSVAGAAGVLQGSASVIPTFTTTPTLTGTNFTGIPNAALTNSSVTVGSTSISLGATSTSLAGLTTLSMNNQLTNTLATGTAPFVISSTTRVSNLNVATAGTADVLTTARTINGTSFDGSTNITVTAAAGTLTGATLNSGVTASSLTSVGTLSALAVTGTTTQTGALNLAGAGSPLQVGGSAGSSGQVLTSAGAGATPTWSAAGTGTVTSVSVVTANGVSGSVATATTTPAITLSLGAITPSSITMSSLGSASAPVYTFTGDTNTGIYSSASETVDIASRGLRAASITTPASTVNYPEFSGNITTGPVQIAAKGSDSDIGIRQLCKGNAGLTVASDSGGTFYNMITAGFDSAPSGSGTNYFAFFAANTGNNPYFQCQGVDTNVGLDFYTKGTGTIRMQDITQVIDSTASTSTTTGCLQLSGGIGVAKQVTCTALGTGAPVTKSANFTWAATETSIINNKSGSSCTVTMPSASTYSGRWLYIKNHQAQTVVSGSSDVVPQAGGSAGTAILAATTGKWAALQSDGTNWQIMMSN